MTYYGPFVGFSGSSLCEGVLYFSGLAYRSSPSPRAVFLLSMVTGGVSSFQFFFASGWWVHLPTLVTFRGAVSLSPSAALFFLWSSVAWMSLWVNFGVKRFFWVNGRFTSGLQ